MFEYNKRNILRSRKEIDLLFKDGNTFICYPFRIIWLKENAIPKISLKILISVSKKYSKRAVKRNKIKRRIKESFRLLFPNLYQLPFFNMNSLSIAILYISKEEEPYQEISTKLNQVFNTLIQKCSV